MVWLPDGEKILMIGLCLFVLIQLMNVTDRQTPHDDTGRAFASHRAAKAENLCCFLLNSVIGSEKNRFGM